MPVVQPQEKLRREFAAVPIIESVDKNEIVDDWNVYAVCFYVKERNECGYKARKQRKKKRR